MSDNLFLLQKLMKEEGIAALLVPHGDVHQSEYVPDCYKRLEWLTGFTGSAGLSLVTQGSAILFVDGRYTIQAAAEVSGSWQIASLRNDDIKNVMKDVLQSNGHLHYDPWLISYKSREYWMKWIASVGGTFVPLEKNLIDAIWLSPPMPRSHVFEYPVEFSGQSSQSKRQELCQVLSTHNQNGKLSDGFFFSDPHSIAWLLNWRGNDVATTPIFLSFAFLDRSNGVILWMDNPVDIPIDGGIEVRPYDFEDIKKILCSYDLISIDPAKTPSAIIDYIYLQKKSIFFADDIVTLPKAIKNSVQIQGMRDAHLYDGIALSKCLSWIEDSLNSDVVITELDVVDKLYEFRSQSPYFRGVSFDTIAASGPNGAIVHYRPSAETNRALNKGEVFLLDSGGQYFQGTTDVTRTICVGPVKDEVKNAYTRVLKGHIAIARAVFPEGTTGSQIDVLARQFLWEEGMDYSHGTGHGVGSYLSVHEGPQGISGAASVPLLAGMVLSNEPGFYKADDFGIRIESLLLVVPSKKYLGYLCFETLTCAPIATNMINFEILSNCEKNWLDQYNQCVVNALSNIE